MAVFPAQAVIIDLGSLSGNTLTDEVLAYGWIRSDAPTGHASAGETNFVGTTGPAELRGYVSFNLAGFNVGDTINNATVSLFSQGVIFDSAGTIFTDANNIGLNITSLANVTGYGSTTPAILDSDGVTQATWNGLNGLYGAVLDTAPGLDLDNMAIDDEVTFDVTAAIQTAVNAGDSKISFGFTSPDAVATGARNFFVFEGMDQGATFGPNLNVDFTATVIPEPSSSALLGLGAFALILRRRK